MLLYIISSLLFLFITSGLGFILLSKLKYNFPVFTSSTFTLIYFTGFIFISLMTGYLSLIIPINHVFTIIISIFTMIGIYQLRGSLKHIFKNHLNFTFIDFLVLAFIFIFLTFFSSVGIRNFDSTLYHIQAIKWINLFSVVPGLGNLHERFAFNSMFFPISAALSVNTFIGHREFMIYPLNTISFFVFLNFHYFRIKKYWRLRDYKSIIFSIFLCFLTLIYLLKWVSSPSPDVICALLTMFLLQWIFFKESFDKLLTVIIFCLICLCLTYKLSLVTLMILAFFLYKKNKGVEFTFLLSVTGLIVVLPFLIRNYFLSGYLIYPFPHFDFFNPDWKIPISKVIDMQIIIKSFAIYPLQDSQEVLKSPIYKWLPIWFEMKDSLMKLLLIISNLFLILSLCYGLYLKNKKLILLSMFMTITFLFWFLQAPDPRFIYGIIFFAVSYFIYILTGLLFKKMNDFYFKFFIAFILFGFISLTGYTYFKMVQSYKSNLALLLFPRSFYKDFPIVYPKKHINNFEFYYPSYGDACFNLPLPCSPSDRNADVYLRGKSLNDGFKIGK